MTDRTDADLVQGTVRIQLVLRDIPAGILQELSDGLYHHDPDTLEALRYLLDWAKKYSEVPFSLDGTAFVDWGEV